MAFIRQNYQEEITRAQVNQSSHQEFLEDILTKELEYRRERSVDRKIKNARFPYKMILDDFVFDGYSEEIKKQILKLSTLEFIDKKENVILIGNPGVGKTALSISLGFKACLNLKQVLFLNVSDLLIQMREAMSQNQISRYKRKFEKFDLVILDELGFISFDKEAGELLFNLISSRVQKGSMIITSNLTINKWNEIFHDPILTTALADRLAYKSYLLDMSGESHRVTETRRWQEKS